MKLIIKQKKKNEYVNTLRFNQVDEATGKTVSTALICIRSTRFAGKFIPTMTVADVSTLPEYRNRGLVREMLNVAHSKAREYGAYISLLHPFSFDFYRKFGYEKISDTVSATFDAGELAAPSDTAELVPINEKYYDDVLSLFKEFSRNRNLMLDRYNISAFLRRSAETMLYFKDKILCGYIIFQKDTESRKITVSEVVFKDKDALKDLLYGIRKHSEGFVKIEILDCEPIPEIYELLENKKVTYDSRGDLAARVLDTEALLLAHEYPEARGEFTVSVTDTLPTVSGIFKIMYEGKKCTVERLTEDIEADVTMDASLLLRTVYGCDIPPDIERETEAIKDFYRAFPKQTNGLYEHF